jgi:hypothetical protein
MTSLGLHHVSCSIHNIKRQRAGAKALYWRLNLLPAADLGVRRIEKRERETPLDKLGVDGVGGDRCPAPNKVVQRWV